MLFSKILMLGLIVGSANAAMAGSVRCVALQKQTTSGYFSERPVTERLVGVELKNDEGMAKLVKSINFKESKNDRDLALSACQQAVSDSNLCTDQQWIPKKWVNIGDEKPFYQEQGGYLEVKVSNGLAAHSVDQCRALEGIAAAKKVRDSMQSSVGRILSSPEFGKNMRGPKF